MSKKITSTLLLFTVLMTSYAQKKWTLDDCISHAKTHNIDILRQQLQNLSLKEDITVAKGNYFPDFSFNASEGISFTRGAFNASTGITTSSSNFTNLGFNTSVTLFSGNRNNYTLQQAKLAVQKGEIDIERFALDLSLQITNQYLQVLFNKGLLGIALEQKDISDQEVKRLTKLHEAALRSKSELLQIQSTNATDIKNVVEAQNTLNNSLIQLKQLLDINNIDGFDISEINVSTYDAQAVFVDPNTVFENALQNNPTIAATSLQYKIDEKNIKISKSALYPSLSLNAGYSTSFFGIEGGNNLFFEQLRNNQTQNISLGLNVPIFSRFSTRSNIDKAKVALELTKTELTNQKSELKNRIAIAHNDVMTAKAVLKAAETASQAQTEVFTIDQQKYREGYMTSEDYLLSKGNYVRAESELERAKYDYIFKLKVLDYYK